MDVYFFISFFSFSPSIMHIVVGSKATAFSVKDKGLKRGKLPHKFTGANHSNDLLFTIGVKSGDPNSP